MSVVLNAKLPDRLHRTQGEEEDDKKKKPEDSEAFSEVESKQ